MGVGQMGVEAIAAITSGTPGGGSPLAVQNLDAVATALGISVIELKVQLQSGMSLSGIVARQHSMHHPHAGVA